MKIKLSFPLAIFIFFLGISPSYADGITIGDGAALVLNDASMNLGCSDIVIEDGGTFDVGSGAITRVRHLLILTAGPISPGPDSFLIAWHFFRECMSYCC